MLILLACFASAADITALDENFDAYTTASFSGTASWTTGYASDPWSTYYYGGVYAKTDDSTGTWGSGGAVDNHLVYTGDSWDDFTFDATLYQTDNDSIGLVFRYVDTSNYYLLFFPGGDQGPNTGTGTYTTPLTGTYVYKISAGSATLVKHSTTSLTTSKSIPVEVIVSGTNIDVYVDNNQNGAFSSSEHLIDTTDATFTTGEVGLYCYNDGETIAGCYFDDVAVYLPDADSDGVADYEDNCPSTSNAGQDDLDLDGTGDACDSDADGDGYVTTSKVDYDCDDADASVNPGATESCATTVDDNCDSSTNDEGATGCTTRYYDADGDTYGIATSSCTCTATGAYTASNTTDCDDADSADHPGGIEVCNGDDEDCDGTADNDAIDRDTWYADSDGDGYGDLATSTLSCSQPKVYVADATDCDDGAAGVYPGAIETCDGIDEDCDTVLDNDAVDAITSYADADSDSYGNPGDVTVDCVVPTGNVYDATDCDDARADIYPGATEVCDDADQNCNGFIDDDSADAINWYTDGDGDLWGNLADSIADCNPQPGRVDRSGDCADGNAAINPDADEVCNGVDDDCDGVSDEDALDASTWYADADDDGHGDPATVLLACELPNDASATDDDCDDSRADTYAGAPELPDEIDNDCNGLADDGIDTDGDGLDDYAERTTYDTDPYLADTDGDGLEDGDEVARGTDPTLTDTDGGGASDGAEVLVDGTDPLNAKDDVHVDTDGDGLTDSEEAVLHTDPNNADTDGGGVEDGAEVDAGTDPLNPADDVPTDDVGSLAREGGLYGGCGAAVPFWGLGLVALAARKRRSR